MRRKALEYIEKLCPIPDANVNTDLFANVKIGLEFHLPTTFGMTPTSVISTLRFI